MLNHIQFSMLPLRRSRTVGTDTVHFQAMTCHPKTAILGNPFQNFRDRVVRKLNHVTAFLADQMIVVRIPVIVLVDLAII